MFIIVGPIHGGSTTICTWQVTLDGLAYLRSRGVSDRGVVSVGDIQSLSQKRWIYTRGEAPPGKVDPSDYFDIDLLERLIDWSYEGGVTGFEFLFVPKPGPIDQFLIDRIFSRKFVGWLRTLVGGGTLAEFDEISYSDFNALAGDRLERLESTLHRLSAIYCENRLAWRLAEIIGKVAWQVEAGGGCPKTWSDQYPILARLHERLSGEEGGTVGGTETGRRVRRSSPVAPRPYIWWSVDDQKVIAILPGVTLPPAHELTWSVVGTEVAAPEAFPTPDGLRFSESRSDPLDPMDHYTIRAVVSPHGDLLEKTYRLPPGDNSLVLFSADGRLLSFEQDSPLSLGPYLALLRKARIG